MDNENDEEDNVVNEDTDILLLLLLVLLNQIGKVRLRDKDEKRIMAKMCKHNCNENELFIVNILRECLRYGQGWTKHRN